MRNSDQGASLRDRATRPPAQAPSGLGDTASVPSAADYADTQRELIDELADTLRDVGNVLVGYGREFGQIGTSGHARREVAFEHANRLFEQYYRLRPEARP